MTTYNFPIECDISSYDIAITEYVSLVSKFPEVKSIVQIGNVGVSGISDIDLIVYLDDTQNCNNNYSLYQISKKYHNILMHDVFIIPYKLMPQSFLITSIFDTKVIFGKDINISVHNDLEKNYENLILLNDIAIVSLLKEYTQWYDIENKDIKLIIARLNSIKYPIMLLTSIYKYYSIELNNKQMYEDFVSDFTIFRKEWFSKTKEFNVTTLLKFIKRAKDDIAPNILKDTIFINNHICIYESLNNKISFNTGQDTLKGDKSLFLNILAYSSEEGSISEHIKKSINTNIIIKKTEPQYEELLKSRIGLINQCYDFREKNKIYYGELWQFGKKTKIPLYIRIINKIKRIIYAK